MTEKETQNITPEKAKNLAFYWILDHGEYLEYKDQKNLRKIYMSNKPDEGEITLNTSIVNGYIVKAEETVERFKLKTKWEIFGLKFQKMGLN